MGELTPPQLLFIVRQHLEAGRLQEADDLCRRLLAERPGDAAALHLAGILATRSGRPGPAESFLRRAVEAALANPAPRLDLARLLRRAGRLDEAISEFCAALAWQEVPTARVELASAFRDAGRFGEAIELLERSLELTGADGLVELGEALIQTNRIVEAAARLEEARAGLSERPALSPELLVRLASGLQACGRLEAAILVYDRLLSAEPEMAAARVGMAAALRTTGRAAEAAELVQKVIADDPSHAPAFAELGDCLLELGHPEQGLEAYERALSLAPGDATIESRVEARLLLRRAEQASITACLADIARSPESAHAYCGAGVALQRSGDFDAALKAYAAALSLDPGHAPALNNLGLVLRDAGRLEDALACCRRAAELAPQSPTCHANLLYLMHFHPECDAAVLNAAHSQWGRRYADPLTPSPQEAIANTSCGWHVGRQQRLRVGYISPNLRLHPVGRFLLPLFEARDAARQEVYVYSSLAQHDFITARLKEKTDIWVEAGSWSDAELAERIEADGIDVLVDLTLHMADGRLLAFARKPAPVQVSYLAYCSTTGVKAIDYRLTDQWLDPPGTGGHGFVERPLYLSRYWCYAPGLPTPSVSPLPAMSRPHFTFASLNSFGKVTPAALGVWAQILRQTAPSRLLIHARRGAHRDRALRRFEAEGVDPSRIEFFDMLSMPKYFQLHRAIDLALDPFPYPGGTTTCDALWMGVPTVSLVGALPFTRSGLSILSAVALEGLAVDTVEAYVRTAAELRNDLPRLASIRTMLRDRMLGSPLMDAQGFARSVEEAFESVRMK